MESRNRAWGRQKPYAAWKQRCAATTAVGDFEGTGVTHGIRGRRVASRRGTMVTSSCAV